MVKDEFLNFIDTNIYHFIKKEVPEPDFDPIADGCESQAFFRKFKFSKSVARKNFFTEF